MCVVLLTSCGILRSKHTGIMSVFHWRRCRLAVLFVSFQRYQLNRALLHDSKRVTSEQTQTCAEDCIMLGQIDRAVQLLLETEPCSSSYYLDCLRFVLSCCCFCALQTLCHVKVSSDGSHSTHYLLTVFALSDIFTFAQTAGRFDIMVVVAIVMIV